MLLVTYPIFADCCSLIGKLSNIQDTFTTSWLKDRLYEIWGERSTLYYSIGRILQTLKYLAVIEPIKPGVYKIKQRKLVSPEAIEVLLMAILLLKEKAYYGIPELTCLPKLFPFVFDVSYEWLHNSDVFKLASFGGKIVLMTE
ncbi:MAG: hypothetical protein BWY62_00386 [Firmicutes bacterium ADurb.Bin356]|nr:MAG: hypothetical protein BWY62_00386 [Firmicutes bacterium ADurb.Bin356]